MSRLEPTSGVEPVSGERTMCRKGKTGDYESYFLSETCELLLVPRVGFDSKPSVGVRRVLPIPVKATLDSVGTYCVLAHTVGVATQRGFDGRSVSYN